jgi:hypothetical protein
LTPLGAYLHYGARTPTKAVWAIRYALGVICDARKPGPGGGVPEGISTWSKPRTATAKAVDRSQAPSKSDQDQRPVDLILFSLFQKGRKQSATASAAPSRRRGALVMKSERRGAAGLKPDFTMKFPLHVQGPGEPAMYRRCACGARAASAMAIARGRAHL